MASSGVAPAVFDPVKVPVASCMANLAEGPSGGPCDCL